MMHDSSYQDLMDYLAETAHFGGRKTTEYILKNLAFKNKNPLVLDAGCGTGKTLNFLSKKMDCHIFGIDRNKRFISKAKKLAPASHVIVGDITNLPFKDRIFDAVICEDVLPFIEDVERCIKEFARVLKRKGFIAITSSLYFKKPDEKIKKKMQKLYGMRINNIIQDDLLELLKKYNVGEIKVIEPDISVIDGVKALRLLSWFKMFFIFLISKNLRRLISLLIMWLSIIKSKDDVRYVIIVGRIK